MIKILAMAAMAVCFSNANATAELPDSVKSLVATVNYTAVAAPVSVTHAAWNRINESSANAALVRMVADDPSQCLASAPKYGDVTACTLKLDSGFVTAFWSTSGFFIADATEIAPTNKHIFSAWSRAFDACFEATKASLALPVGLVCKVISFTLNIAGTIISVVGNVTVEALRALIGGIGMVVSNLIALPVHLLTGHIGAAFVNLFNIVKAVVVCVFPLAPIVMALLGRSDEIRELCK